MSSPTCCLTSRRVGPAVGRDEHPAVRQASKPMAQAAFIVHGHDHDSLRSLERYLTETLGLPPPKVLGDLASGGQTLIEKLEEVGSAVDVVFVLMTPDDTVTTSAGTSGRQARPNVLLEAGYFSNCCRDKAVESFSSARARRCYRLIFSESAITTVLTVLSDASV